MRWKGGAVVRDVNTYQLIWIDQDAINNRPVAALREAFCSAAISRSFTPSVSTMPCPRLGVHFWPSGIVGRFSSVQSKCNLGEPLSKANFTQSIFQKLADVALERRRTQFGLKLKHDRVATPTVYFLAPDRQAPVSYTHLTLPTNREV